MYVGIKDNRIWDICSDLRSKRTDFNLPIEVYLDLPMGDRVVGDTWDSKNNVSLKDSPRRFIEPPKSEFELLQEKTIELEKKLLEIEKNLKMK